MFYASDIRLQTNITKGIIEDNPKALFNEIAILFCHQVEVCLRQAQFKLAFQRTQSTLSRVRGRIDHLQTDRGQLLRKGQVYCHYDHLTYDIPRYQYVLAALTFLMQKELSKSVIQNVCTLRYRLLQLGIKENGQIQYSYHPEQFSYREENDLLMIMSAQLIFNMGIPVDDAGFFYFNQADDQDNAWLRRLFEKAIGGFYQFWLDKNQWQVSTGSRLFWQKGTSISTGIADILPNMKADIIIHNLRYDKELIIDTKFNQLLTQGWYRDRTLRNHYLYQIYSYIRSQEIPHKPHTLSRAGMLLHPAVDEDFTEYIEIQGHIFYFCTVNLMASTKEIQERLLQLISLVFERNTL